MTNSSAPQLILLGGKDAIQKALVEDDLVKSPEYELFRINPGITSLFTERDKIAYRQKVRLGDLEFSNT